MATKVTTDHGSPEDEVAIPPECLDSVSDSSVSLTAGKENTLNTGERDPKYVLDKEEHHKFLRLGRALIYLKEPLHKPVLLKINKLHCELKNEMHKAEKTKDGIKKINKTILIGLLSKRLNKFDESNKIYKNNLNIEKWEDEPWETAKAFMQSGQTEGNNSPDRTDIMGILRLISSCKQFDDWLKVDADGVSGQAKVQKVLILRHSVGHSYNWCCTEMEMEKGIEEIKILMEHMKQTFKSFADDANFSKDDKRIYQEAAKKMEDALDRVEKVKTDTDFDLMRRLVAEDICKSRAYESANVTQRQLLVKIQSRYATRKIFIVLNDLYKEHSKVFKEYLQKQGSLESFIIEANPDVTFLLAALEEKQMFQTEMLDDLLHLTEPLLDSDDLQQIKKSMTECKTTLEMTSAIASGTVYDVFILHCEADREEANTFRQCWLDSPQDLNPPAKMILYDEYVRPGTSHVSALDYVLEYCRLVFILCTKAFLQDNLSKFQAEIVKSYSFQKDEGPRVIPVYLCEEDWKCSPPWIRVMPRISVWKYSNTSLMNILMNGRKKYLKSCQ